MISYGRCRDGRTLKNVENEMWLIAECRSCVELPRDLLVRHDTELARITRDEAKRQMVQEAEYEDDDDDNDEDSELSDLDDELFEGSEMRFPHPRQLTQEEREEAKRQMVAVATTKWGS
jgi:hypothetical protein